MRRALKAVCLAPLIAVAAVCGCKTSPQTLFFKQSGVKLPKCLSVEEINTRGWFGDGEEIYIYRLGGEEGNELNARLQGAEHWSPLPMTDVLNDLVYNIFGEHSRVPRVERGYYFFHDEQDDKYYADADYIESSYSFDFVLCMYDSGEKTAYYYEQHT